MVSTSGQKITRFFRIDRNRDLTILLLLLVVSLIPRLVRLDSVPPGLDGDELFNAIDALRINRGYIPAYFEGNNGREALFLYFIAGSLRVVGQTIWAIRLPAVLMGSGSVLLAYLVGKSEFNRRVGLMGALLMTVSLWPIMLSRWGLRAISLTFFSALTVYLYSLALRRGNRTITIWIGAGASLGLTHYTYIPARTFSMVIVGWFSWLLISQRGFDRQRWRNIIISFLTALVVFLPYGLYMVNNPDLVNQRVSGLTTSIEKAQAGEPEAIWQTVTSTLELFTIQGDPAERYNVSGRPIFDPITGVFFYTGLAACLWFSFRRQDEPFKQAAYGLLLIWTAAMLAPSFILGTHTSSLRNSGAIVPIYIVTAVGIDTLYLWVRRKWPQRNLLSRYSLAFLFGLGLLLTGIETWRTYFLVWPSQEKVREVYHSGLAEIGRYLDKGGFQDQSNLFVAYDYAADATPQSFNYYSQTPVAWFEFDNSFPWRPDDRQATYFVTIEKPLPQPILERIEPIARVSVNSYTDGDPAFLIYTIDPSSISWEPSHPTNISFFNGPTLIGADLPEDLQKGQSIDLTLHWTIPKNLNHQSNRLTFSEVRLQDLSGNEWSREESLIGFPQAGWLPGDRFVQTVELVIPEGMPPGPVFLQIGLRDGEGPPYQVTSDFLEGVKLGQIGPFFVQSKPFDIGKLPESIPVFDGTVALKDHAFSTLLVPGMPIDLSLEWIAIEKPLDDYRLQLNLLEGDTQERFFSQIYELWPDIYPPSSWEKGEVVTTFHRLEVPLDIPIDSNPLITLNLLPPDGDLPLALKNGDNLLAELTLVLRDHMMDKPEIPNPLPVDFGDEIRFLGFELDESDSYPGGELRLRLFWQALDSPSKNYTVFNHLKNSGGQIWGQFDSPPVGDAWLTSTWLPGEFIVEDRIIPISVDAPLGVYDLIIGLYDPSDLTRVLITVAEQTQLLDELILTQVEVLEK